jgi:hypothetical protein
MRNATDMPELSEDLATGRMHRVGDPFPAGNLFGGMNAGGADIPDALRADLRGLGDDQTGAGALDIIVRRERIGHIALERAAACHRRHHHAVLQGEIAQRVGRKQRRFALGCLPRGSLDSHGVAPSVGVETVPGNRRTYFGDIDRVRRAMSAAGENAFCCAARR